MIRDLISVVIPVYNAEPFLMECLDSCLDQSYSSIDVIVIDDGSTDRSAAILDDYALKDSRITVIHKSNEGYGKSVNLGIDRARGEWIAILEPDDYTVPYMYGELLRTAKKHEVDFIKSNFYEFRETEGYRRFTYRQTIAGLDFYDRVFCPRNHENSITGFCANWTGLYRKSFLDEFGIRHNVTPGASYQDTGFNFLVNAYARRAYYMHEAFYHYRCDNPNSSVLQKDKVYFINEEMEYIRKHIKKYDGQLFDSILPMYMLYKFLHYTSNMTRIDTTFKPDFVKRWSSELWEHRSNGELPNSFINRYDISYNIKMLLFCPEKYLETAMNPGVVADRSCLAEYYAGYISRFKNVWLYGAGKVARDFSARFEAAYPGKIHGYYVTKMDREYDNEKPIVVFSAEKHNGNDLIIICCSPKFSDEIEKLLGANHITEYLLSREIVF